MGTIPKSGHLKGLLMVVITGPYQVSHLICGDPRLDATGGPRHMGGPPNRFCVWLAPPNAPFEPPMFIPDQGHRQVSEVHIPHVTQRLGQSREHEPILQEKIHKNITDYKYIHMSTSSRNLKTNILPKKMARNMIQLHSTQDKKCSLARY